MDIHDFFSNLKNLLNSGTKLKQNYSRDLKEYRGASKAYTRKEYALLIGLHRMGIHSFVQ